MQGARERIQAGSVREVGIRERRTHKVCRGRLTSEPAGGGKAEIVRTRGVGRGIPALVVTVNRYVEAQVLRQVVVVAVAKHIRVVACRTWLMRLWRRWGRQRDH